MPIVVTCECGKQLKAPDTLSGKKGKCPECGNTLLISAPAPARPPEADPLIIDSAPPEMNVAEEPLRLKTPPPEDDLALQSFNPVSAPAQPPAHPQPVAATPRAQLPNGIGSLKYAQYRYLLFCIALLPLVFSIFTKDDNVVERLQKTISEAPAEVKQKLEALDSDPNATEDSLFALLPGNKIGGALLSRSTYAHWFYAAVSSAIFLAAIMLLFPLGNANLSELIKIGLFTGTIGIFMLLAVQYIAGYSQLIGVHGGGKIAILILIAKFIAFSYNAAMDPENGFILSFVGFTCGVGLCEELCKAFPIVKHFTKTAKLDVYGALAWGLASGIGFGVSEGIHYAAEYNGVSGGEIYIIRFVSCVALHAIWCGAVGIALHRNQNSFQGGESAWEMAIPIIIILSVPMTLHGLYDTLLKRDMSGWAVVTAIASFVWLVYQIERARQEHEPSIGNAQSAPGYI